MSHTQQHDASACDLSTGRHSPSIHILCCSGILANSAVKVDSSGLRQIRHGVTFNKNDFSTDKMANEIELIVSLVTTETKEKATGGVPQLLSFPYLEPVAPIAEGACWYVSRPHWHHSTVPDKNTPGYLTKTTAAQIFRPKDTAGQSGHTPVSQWPIQCCRFAANRAHVRCLVEYVMKHDNTLQNVVTVSPFLGGSQRLVRIEKLLAALLDQADPAVLEHNYFVVLRQCIDDIKEKKAVKLASWQGSLSNEMKGFIMSDAADEAQFKHVVREARKLMLSSTDAVCSRRKLIVKKLGSVALIPPVQVILESAVWANGYHFHDVESLSTGLGVSGAGVRTAERVREFCKKGTDLEPTLQALQRIAARNTCLCSRLTSEEQVSMMFVKPIVIYLLRNTKAGFGREMFLLTSDTVNDFKQTIAKLMAVESEIINSWEPGVRDHYVANRTAMLKAYVKQWIDRFHYVGGETLTISTALLEKNDRYYDTSIKDKCTKATQLQRFLGCIRFVDPQADYQLAANIPRLSPCDMPRCVEIVQARTIIPSRDSAADGERMSMQLVGDYLTALLCKDQPPETKDEKQTTIDPVLQWIKLSVSSAGDVNAMLTTLCTRTKTLSDALALEYDNHLLLLEDGITPNVKILETAYEVLHLDRMARRYVTHIEYAMTNIEYRRLVLEVVLQSAQYEVKALEELCSEASRDWWYSLDPEQRDAARREHLLDLGVLYSHHYTVLGFQFQHRRLRSAEDFNGMIKKLAATDTSLIAAQIASLKNTDDTVVAKKKKPRTSQGEGPSV